MVIGAVSPGGVVLFVAGLVLVGAAMHDLRDPKLVRNRAESRLRYVRRKNVGVEDVERAVRIGYMAVVGSGCLMMVVGASLLLFAR
jgi:hypothetical protein